MSFEFGKLSEKMFLSIADSDARINIWHGAVRSGKTICSLIKWGLYLNSRKNRFGYMMVGKTLGTLERNCIRPLQAMFGERNVIHKPHGQPPHILFFDKFVDLVGASDSTASDIIRGVTLEGAYGDELTIWHESIFLMLLSRLSIDGAQFFGTTNADSPAHWLKKGFIDQAGKEVSVQVRTDAGVEWKSIAMDLKEWSFGLDDNPNLSAEYKDSLRREYVGLWYKRFIDGLWVMAEGSIYDMLTNENMFDDKNQEAKRAKSNGRRFIFIDYGTSNPFVALDAYTYEGKMWIWNEYRYDKSKSDALRQKTDSEYCSDIISFMELDKKEVEAFIIDPSAASMKEELTRANFNVIQADNDVLDGIRRTSTALTKKKIMFHEGNCSDAIAEMQSYRWSPASMNNGKEEPIKEKDHAPDALRYGVNTIGEEVFNTISPTTQNAFAKAKVY